MVINNRLLITCDLVRLALDNLINLSVSYSPSPLCFLLIVDQYLSDNDLSFTSSHRQYALNNLLMDVIAAQYRHFRTILNLDILEDHLGLNFAIDAIRTDAATANPELLGWSWLYFHYVTNFFRLSHQEFAEWVNVDERTLRRYQQNAFQKMADHLVKLESHEHEKRRYNLLILQLPHQGAVRLIGRDQELNRIRSIFAEEFPPHIMITGPRGIGKSTFVEYAVKEIIDSGQQDFDHIVWIDNPVSVRFIEEYLREQLLSEQTSVTISEYFLLKRVAIILDDISELQNTPDLLETFLHSMSNVSLLMTSRRFHANASCCHLILTELSNYNVHKLVALQISSPNARPKEKADSLVTHDATMIWKKVGGNPSAVILLTQNLTVFDFHVAVALTVDGLCAELYSRLDAKSSGLWFILSLFRQNQHMIPEEIIGMWPSTFSFEDFIPLIRAHLVEVKDSTAQEYTLSSSAYHFIRSRYEVDHELQLNAQELFQSLDVALPYSNILIEFVETILLLNWIKIDVEWRIESAKKLWRASVREGRWSIWRIILAQYVVDFSSDKLDLAMGYGICLRCLAQWTEAEHVFESIINYAGKAGLFTEQLNARLELAVLLRYRGEYGRSRLILEQIKTLPAYSGSGVEVLVEEIELALEMEEPNRAADLLYMLPETPRKLILQMETSVATKNNDITYLQLLAEKSLSSFESNPATQARIYVLLGRSFEKVGEYESAKIYFSIAVKLLEQWDNDPYGMARSQSNLGAVLIHTGNYVDAHELLVSAKHVQNIIKDHRGMATTLHNLRQFSM